jgi:hypothetical protein
LPFSIPYSLNISLNIKNPAGDFAVPPIEELLVLPARSAPWGWGGGREGVLVVFGGWRSGVLGGCGGKVEPGRRTFTSAWLRAREGLGSASESSEWRKRGGGGGGGSFGGCWTPWQPRCLGSLRLLCSGITSHCFSGAPSLYAGLLALPGESWSAAEAEALP